MRVLTMLRSFLFFVLACGILNLANGLPRLIRIGGLFDTDDDEQELAFRIAVDRINTNNSILNGSKIAPLVERIEPNDSFDATKKFCVILQSGIAAAFGPQSNLQSTHVQSICDALEVPHIVSRWDYHLQRDDLSVNLYPHPAVLSKAFVQLVTIWGWTKFFLLYEENEGIIRLQDFLIKAEVHGWEVKIFQFPNSSSYRDVFWDIKRSVDKRGKQDSDIDYKIVLDVPRKNLFTVLKSAQQVGMMTEKQTYLVTCLDLHTIDLEDFQYGKTNMTGLRLVQVDDIEYQLMLKEMNHKLTKKRNQPPLKALKTESALIYDTVKLFALALEEMDTGKNVMAFSPISCNTMNKGTDGTSLSNYMKSLRSTMRGVTGQVKFDPEGFRSTVSLDIMYLTPNGLQKIGSMIPGESVNITRQISSDFQFMELENQHFYVTTFLTAPYTMLKESSKKLQGNEQYEGFTIDLMNELAKVLHFTYEIHEVQDKKYGSKLDENTWDGMIGEVMTGVAKMAIADLTITSQREEAVDFTMPFMNTGISILFKKPTTKITSLFSFLSPFSGEVWIYVMGAYLTVSFVLFVVGRLSPYEWSNPHPCRKNDVVEENNFSLLNSMWFTIGSLMQQGSDLAPSASSTRTIASIWYFFNLIMISSYTANLAAFLTVEKVVYPIENAQDLAKQEKIKYGCLSSGSTKAFFMNSNISTYATMWTFMERNPDVLMANNDEAKKKVNEGNYAYLMEATSIEYTVERECNLTQIGGLLDTKGYGIAVNKNNSKLRAWLSGGILRLQEKGYLHTYKERWWKQKKGGGKCTESSKSSSTVNELGLANVGGVFVVMLLGLCLSAVVAVLEFCWFNRQIVKTKKESLCSKLINELKFAASCGSSSKPAPKLLKTQKREKTSASSAIPGYNTLY